MIRVLIVDDHAMVRRGLKEVFADAFAELQVGEAETSQSALEQVLARAWDLVLLDINIPGRNGLELLEEMKRLRPDTPVLVLSQYPEEEFAIRSLKLGAAGYLNKTRASDEVVAAAKKAVAGGKYITASLAERLAATLAARGEGVPHEKLSDREYQVMKLIAGAKSVKEIAKELSLGEKTIFTYRARLLEKLGLKSDVEVARYALQHHLVES